MVRIIATVSYVLSAVSFLQFIAGTKLLTLRWKPHDPKYNIREGLRADGGWLIADFASSVIKLCYGDGVRHNCPRG